MKTIQVNGVFSLSFADFSIAPYNFLFYLSDEFGGI